MPGLERLTLKKESELKFPFTYKNRQMLNICFHVFGLISGNVFISHVLTFFQVSLPSHYHVFVTCLAKNHHFRFL